MKPQNVDPASGVVFACFLVTWIVLGIGGFLLFYAGKDIPFKRKWFPRFVALTGFLFIAFATGFRLPSSQSLETLIFIVPATCLISYLNIKLTKFCDACGATIAPGNARNLFAPAKFCPDCGAALDPKPKKTFDDMLD